MLVELLPLAQTSRLDFGTQTDSHETELRPERDRAELRPPGDRRAKREARASDGVTAPGPVSCAESLMEQLRKSKKRGGELQAARELAREEFLTCRSELQECQATLRRQVVRSDGSEPTYESREARGSLRSSEKESDVTTSLMDSKDTAPIGEEFTLRPPEWKGAPGQARLSQCFGTLRKLHHELSKELQSRSKSQGKPEDVWETRPKGSC
ncbi:unnamed protein product [Durusdinium trenchii]|uniref:Uncharacterized protein n=1 Tax=Durusdinium trenchii TaxID=1381693 RepID=A0ABP0NSG8_9DINO